MERRALVVAVLAATTLCAQAQTLRVVRFAEAKPFRMGKVTSNRLVHPDMGARHLTLNFSISEPGNEFAQHVHDYSDDTILILEGQGDLRQGDSRRTFFAGQSAFVPSGQIHGTITTGASNAVMISFQTPPDLVLYTGARDSSLPGAAAPKGVVTPGAVRYVDYAARNGLFAHPGMGAPRIAASHRRLAPGEKFSASVRPGGEQVLFVWKGAIAVTAKDRQERAGERDAVFVSGPLEVEVRNDSPGPAVVIQAQAPPPGPAPAPPEQLNGRWVIHVPGDPDRRVYWLEVSGAGTDKMSGRFFGATGGRMATLLDPVIAGHQFQFRVERTFPGPSPRLVRAMTAVRLSGDSLSGETRNGSREFRWTGWRAPTLSEKDDGAWREGTPVRLLDGDGLARWTALDGGDKKDWVIENAILRNRSNQAGLILSHETFWNFKLHLEFRVPRGSNSGLGLRGRYEVQILDDHGQPPDIHGNGSIYSRLQPRVNASKPAGEWQSFDITLIGREVSLALNGVKTIDRQQIDGLCGLATDPWEDRPGPISLQGDHGPVEFRNLIVTPLVRGR